MSWIQLVTMKSFFCTVYRGYETTEKKTIIVPLKNCIVLVYRDCGLELVSYQVIVLTDNVLLGIWIMPYLPILCSLIYSTSEGRESMIPTVFRRLLNCAGYIQRTLSIHAICTKYGCSNRSSLDAWNSHRWKGWIFGSSPS